MYPTLLELKQRQHELKVEQQAVSMLIELAEIKEQYRNMAEYLADAQELQDELDIQDIHFEKLADEGDEAYDAYLTQLDNQDWKELRDML